MKMKKRRKSHHSQKVPSASATSRGRSCQQLGFHPSNDHNFAPDSRDINDNKRENDQNENKFQSSRGRRKTRQGRENDQVSSVTKARQALSSFFCCCRASEGQRKRHRKASNKSAEVCICSSDDDDEKSPRIRVVNRHLYGKKELEPIKASDPKDEIVMEQIEFIPQVAISFTSQTESSAVQLQRTENPKSILFDSARDNKNLMAHDALTTSREDSIRSMKEFTGNDVQTIVTGRFAVAYKDLRSTSNSKAVARVDFVQMRRPTELSELDILAHQIVENVLSSSIQMFYSRRIPVALSTQNSLISGIEKKPASDVETNVPIDNPDVLLRVEESTAIDILATEIVENALNSGIQIFCSTAFSEKSLAVTAREKKSQSLTPALLSLTETASADSVSDIPSFQDTIVQPVLESRTETVALNEGLTVAEFASALNSQTILSEDSHLMSKRDDMIDIEAVVKELIDDVLSMPIFSSSTVADPLPVSEQKDMVECVPLGFESSQVPVIHVIETNPGDTVQSVVTPVEQYASNSILVAEEIADIEGFAKEIVEEIINSSIQMLCSNTVADKQILQDKEPLLLSHALESLTDDGVSLDTNSCIQSSEGSIVHAVTDVDSTDMQITVTPEEQVSTLPVVPAFKLNTGHFADIKLSINPSNIKVHANRKVEDVMRSSYEMFLFSTVSDNIATVSPQAVNLNKKMLAISCVIKPTRDASMLVTVSSLPSSPRANLSAIEGNSNGKLPQATITEELDSTFLTASASTSDTDQVWEVDSMPELDKLAELEVSDLLTKAIVSNGGKQNAHTTEMVGSGNSSIMPSDILEKERGPTPSSGLLSLPKITEVEIDPNTLSLSTSSTELTNANPCKPRLLPVGSGERSPVFPKITQSNAKCPEYDNLFVIANNMNAAMEILPGHTETSESLPKDVTHDAELLRNIESRKDENLLASTLMDIPLEYGCDGPSTTKDKFDASTFQQSVSAKKTDSIVENNQDDVENTNILPPGSLREMDQTQQIPDVDLYKQNRDKKDVVKSQLNGLNRFQKSLPRQYPSVAELDVMLLFIKTFKDLILALRNEHSKVNPIHERRKKDIQRRRKTKNSAIDTEQDDENSKDSKSSQPQNFPNFGLETVPENEVTSYLLKCKKMNEVIANLRCKAANKTNIDKLSQKDISKEQESCKDGTRSIESGIESHTPRVDMCKNSQQPHYSNAISFDTMCEELTNALANVSLKLTTDDTFVEENDKGKFPKSKTNSKTRRGRSPVRKTESSVRYRRGRCPQKITMNSRKERSRSPSIYAINARCMTSQSPRRKAEYNAEKIEQINGKPRHWEPDEYQKPYQHGFMAKIKSGPVMQYLARCKELAEEIVNLRRKTSAVCDPDINVKIIEAGKSKSDDTIKMNTSMVRKKKKDKWETCNENSRKTTEQAVGKCENVQEVHEDGEMRFRFDSTQKQRARKREKALQEVDEMAKERIESRKNSEERTNKPNNKNMRKAENLVENAPDSILVIDEAKKH